MVTNKLCVQPNDSSLFTFVVVICHETTWKESIRWITRETWHLLVLIMNKTTKKCQTYAMYSLFPVGIPIILQEKKTKDSLFYPAHCFYPGNFTGALVLPLCNCYKECENTIHAV